MSLRHDWVFSIFLIVMLAVPYHILVLDHPVGSIETPEKDPPDKLFREYHRGLGLPVKGRMNATTLRRLDGYDTAWETYHRRMTFRIIQGQYRQQLRNQRAQSDSQLNKNESTEVNTEEIYGHLTEAQSIARGGLEEATSPEAILAAGVSEGTPFEQIETLYTFTQTAYTIYEVNEELGTAQEKAFDQIDAKIASQTGGSQEAVAGNPGYLEAGRAMGFYRYVSLYGSPEEQAAAQRYSDRIAEGPRVYLVSSESAHIEVALMVVEWRKGGNITCNGHDCEYEGDVEYNDGGAIRYVGGTRAPPDANLNTDRFKHRIYYTDNVARWRSALAQNSVDEDLVRFLSGGSFETEMLGGKQVYVHSRNLSESAPRLPERARLTRTNFSRAEHRQLRRMVNISRTHSRADDRLRTRLAQSYHYHQWARRPKLSTHPPVLATATREWKQYHRAVTGTAGMYNPGAYNRSTGTYVDSVARIRAMRTLLSEFDSAEDYESYLENRRSAVEAKVRKAEMAPPGQTLGPFGDIPLAILRLVAFTKASIWGKLFFGLHLIIGLQLGWTAWFSGRWIRERL